MKVEMLNADHDLLGDESIQLLSTPGHTPGHQSVRVGERLVLGADQTDNYRVRPTPDTVLAALRGAGLPSRSPAPA